MLGEAVEHQDLESRHLVDLAQNDVGAGKARLRASARTEDARVQVDARPLGQQVSGARPGDRDRGARFRDIGHGRVR